MSIVEKQVKMYLKEEGLNYSVKTIRYMLYTIEMGKENTLELNVKLLNKIKGLI
jgi:hypothetical protein